MRCALIVILAGWIVAPGVAAAGTLPSGWAVSSVGSDLSAPTSFAFLPDGRIIVTELYGGIRLIVNGQTLPSPLRVVQVTTGAERGLLGVAVDPAFTSNGFVYVYYTTTTSPPRNRVSRLRLVDNSLAPGETILIDDIASDIGIHNAGCLQFGPDGYLYVSTGDGGDNRFKSQDLSNLNGKILRVDRDGKAAPGNPFVGRANARPRSSTTDCATRSGSRSTPRAACSSAMSDPRSSKR